MDGTRRPAGAPPGSVGVAMRRPMLKSGLRRLRRGPGTVQFGSDPERAVLVTGLDARAQRWIEALDGLRGPAGLRAAAAELGLPDESADALLEMLAAAGLLEDAAATCDGLSALPLPVRDRLAPDLASLTLVHRGPGGGKQALAGRLRAQVEVRGGGRVGAAVAALLSAAGVGGVRVLDDEPTTPGDLAPAGLRPGDIGVPRGLAATRSAARAGAGARPGAGSAPDLVVVATDDPLPAGERAALLAANTPHLLASVREIVGVVGPLVLPGRSSCTRCHDLIRADRDPAWPRLAAQLATGPSPREGGGRAARACDAVLATAVASHAALQALAYLDSGTATTVDGTLHVSLPDGTVRRRSWQRHPACGCGWGDQ